MVMSLPYLTGKETAEIEQKDTQSPNPKRLKVDKDDVAILDDYTVSSAAKGSLGASVALDNLKEEPEVRSKLERSADSSVSPEATNSVFDVGNSKKTEEGDQLFYLTKVRGIGMHHNHPSGTIGIKGGLKF